jgi:predicted O-methyltransferase YrrM
VFELIARHTPSAAALTALGAALDARASSTALDPRLAAAIDELLVALGAGDVLEGVSAEEALPALGLLRTSLCTSTKLLFADKRATAWNHTEEEILQGAGDFSTRHAQVLTNVVAPALAGALERIGSTTGALLDIGTGAGGLSIAMAQRWPDLRVVGIDPWQPSLALARANVKRAGLDHRVELREQAAEELEDEAVFDIVWLPIPFMQEPTHRPALERVGRALRPGGWVVAGVASPGTDPATRAAARLQSTTWARHTINVAELQALLGASGLVEVTTLPCGPVSFVNARRAP